MIEITVPSINDRAGPLATRRPGRPGRGHVQRRHSKCRARRVQASRSRLARRREDLVTGDSDEQGFRQVGQPHRLLVQGRIRATGAGRHQGGKGRHGGQGQASRSSGTANHHRDTGSGSGWRPVPESASGPESPGRRGCGPVLVSDGIWVGDWASRP